MKIYREKCSGLPGYCSICHNAYGSGDYNLVVEVVRNIMIDRVCDKCSPTMINNLFHDLIEGALTVESAGLGKLTPVLLYNLDAKLLE